MPSKNLRNISQGQVDIFRTPLSDTVAVPESELEDEDGQDADDTASLLYGTTLSFSSIRDIKTENNENRSSWLRRWTPIIAGATTTGLSFLAIGYIMYVTADPEVEHSTKEIAGKTAVDGLVSTITGVISYGISRCLFPPVVPTASAHRTEEQAKQEIWNSLSSF